jgi:hypothetical protein
MACPFPALAVRLLCPEKDAVNDAEVRRAAVPCGLTHVPSREILAVEECFESFRNLARDPAPSPGRSREPGRGRVEG